MRYKLSRVKAYFKYGILGTTDDKLTCLDIKQWYQDLGGKITTDTEIEFTTHFPKEPYEKTALTHRMPETYLCEGSGSAIIYQPGGHADAISVSVYRDTKGGQPIGDHHNLFLQYDISGGKNHTDEIQNRHIPLNQKIILKPYIDSTEVQEHTAVIG
jgi:hypothetical protein